MKKIVIIPDVHGRTFWKKAWDLIDSVDKVVFLGDYLDPYPRENISNETALTNFAEILVMKGKYPDKVILLIGNHDLHYLPQYKEWYGDRRDNENFDQISKLFTFDLFQISYKLDQYLFTHAGVLQGWLDTINGKKKIRTTVKITGEKQYDINNLNDILIDNPDYLTMIAEERGGRDIYGSCVWADVHEHLYVNWEPPIPNIYQIFGHTMTYPSIKEAYIGPNFAMLDSQNCWLLENGEFTKID